MNPQEARLILQCRRARGQDDSLPAMAEARQTIENLPDLIKELEDDAAFDALIGEKLRSITVPSALRSSILAGARITPQIPWWRRRLTVFSAAALLAIGVSSLLVKPQLFPSGHEIAKTQANAGLTEFRDATTKKVNNGGIHFSKASGDFSELQTYLASHSTSHAEKISSSLSPLPTHGCEIFQWQGHQVTLVCFETQDAGTVHLFTINASDLPADLSAPLLASVNGWETITWKQDGKIMQLIGHTTPERLKQLALPG